MTRAIPSSVLSRKRYVPAGTTASMMSASFSDLTFRHASGASGSYRVPAAGNGCRIAGKTSSAFVATVARRWAGKSPRSGDRSYRRNTEAILPALLSGDALEGLAKT